MYRVMWTYEAPPELTEPVIRRLFSDVAENYIGVPGLIRKYSPEWLAEVTERWGAAPVRHEWIVPVVAESVEGKIVTDAVTATTAS